ncbi:MAG: acetamidase/formamidase family protein [Ardenticatenaceae bacterium]|nr:acetamidase/formamidase family protein [Ardenticatenaceae bacterium]
MSTNVQSQVSAGTNGRSNGHAGHETVYVDQFIDGILDPNKPMLGPVRDGGHIIANTAPGCWGPMITPEIRGGHEVTKPVAVAGAEVGDAIAIRIKDITITSMATASGNDIILGERCLGDPYVAGKCEQCGTVYPKTVIRGIGQEAVRCANCGADATPFKFASGYTIAFDNNRAVGVTLAQNAAETIAHDANYYAAMPENSIQNSVLTFCPTDLVGLVGRLRPFMGQLGTTPSMPMPDSHNAGDFGSFLIGAPHEYGIAAADLHHRTDGHMDIDAVRAGAILICPVKVAGGGVYMGDMHAMQGDGEIAGHTTDVSGTVTLQVHLLKGLNIDGPILFPLAEDLPFLAKPLTVDEKAQALAVAKSWGMSGIEESMPISVVGTGPDLNSATDNGLERAARLLDTTVPAIKNRATITGAIEIGRHPGVVQVTFRAPASKLAEKGLLGFAEDQYAGT